MSWTSSTQKWAHKCAALSVVTKTWKGPECPLKSEGVNDCGTSVQWNITQWWKEISNHTMGGVKEL